MRHFHFIIIVLATLTLAACNGTEEKDNSNETTVTTPKRVFPNFEEKISYAIGFDNGFSITQAYNGENTAGKFDISEIEKGLTDYLGDNDLRIPIPSADSLLGLYLVENGEINETYVSMADASYAIGLVEAQTLVGSMVGRGIDQQMVVDVLIEGVQDGIYGNQETMTLTEARKEVSVYYTDMNKLMGESFLSTNANNPNVTVTESGLQYEVIKPGTGKTPYLTDSVVVHYTGRFIDGRVFESTIPSSIPASFTPMGVIQGWQEGLLLMKEGGSTRFYIPYNLAYGETGSGPIEPYSTLVFDIDLIRVKRFQF